ncbi:mate-domain-containing protein [Syncephalis pseudoplumigaleata]|uniref:Mate-domain-containing protein n=1 Tax=Syncephalis pseudoplumigaleata TaxID=1712513 RepID=A0A4P9YXV4_9FUNG|nr:mate-domain-containing protein [Syncephalis pseudoplumigaleata]|eukprot:RKP24916.1 mate-domain-containing protein [Syncephalis pseudoplumigaleata]
MASPNIPPGSQLSALAGSYPNRPYSFLHDQREPHRRASTAEMQDGAGELLEPAARPTHTAVPTYGALYQDESSKRPPASPDVAENASCNWPSHHWEVGSLTRLATPVVLAYLLQRSIDITSVFSLGHLGASELAASALGTMYNSVTGWSVALGMATALDTLGSQAFTASRDPYALGVYLQRAMLILLVMSVPIAVIWWFAEGILLALGQNPELSALSSLFIRWSLPSLIPYLMFECMKRYLQAQGIMHAGTYILMITSPINVLANYLLVWWPPISLGFIGAPIATSFTHWLNLLLSVLYVRYVQGGACWGGFSRDALRNWGQFLRLGLAGMALICSEWWAFEVVALAAGYLGTIPLAAQSVVLTSATITYMIPAGISITACNRIGNALGRKHANRAKLATHGALLLALAVSTFNTSLILVFKDDWGYLFNSDPEVVALVSKILPIAALFQIGDVFGGVGGGILRGTGQQHLGAYLTMFGYYTVSLPVGIYLTFVLDMGLAGLWWGLCVALFIVAAGEVWAILRLDWDEQVVRCQERIQHEDAYEEETCVV